MAKITLENIRHSYMADPRGEEDFALKKIDAVWNDGGAYALLGPSGCGKTTLLNCIGGLERPDQGSVTCLGQDIHALSRRSLSLFQRQHLGFVFQFGNLLSYLTVYENVSFPLALNNVSRKEQDERVHQETQP